MTTMPPMPQERPMIDAETRPRWFVTSSCAKTMLVFAHELVTNHRGLVSASIMGLSWGIGGIVVIILGQWAQHTSITSAYHLLLGVAAVLVVLAFLLPTRHALRAALEHVPAQKRA